MPKNWDTGGIADSKRRGSPNSSYTLKNANIHEDPGALKCHESLTDDVSGTGPTTSDIIVAIVHTKSKVTYIFSDDGEVWTRSEAGVYALLGAIPPSPVSDYGKINDAKLFNGDIYYTMQQRIGKYTPGDAWNNSTTDGTQNNFKNIDFDLYHPLKVVQNDLYVGNGNHIGKITPDETAGGDITQALLLDSTYTVESLGSMSRYLIVGARISGAAASTFIGFASVFKWDLISNTFTSEQEIKEFGISAFIEFKGSLLFNAGQDGNLYSYDGQFARPFRRIPGSFGNDTTIKKNAWGSLNGITLLGTKRTGVSGIYSLGGFDAKYGDVFNLPFSIDNAEINAIAWAGSDLLIAYRVGGSANYLKKLTTALGTLETESLEQSLVSSSGKRVTVQPRVDYEAYPSGTNIQMYQSVNRGAYREIPLEKNGSNQLIGRAIANAREVQYKLILTPDGTTSPIVEYYGN